MQPVCYGALLVVVNEGPLFSLCDLRSYQSTGEKNRNFLEIVCSPLLHIGIVIGFKYHALKSFQLLPCACYLALPDMP